ncbi:MAG: dephospho-CoA kinase [Candidatus Omnitrophota bacterium]|nr:MAG: dephospho-CoA kinase [Candidatus Omnitrophota bacterium]
MIVIGVTGGFCTGKTTVCAFFRKLGARVIDADKIVHRLYKKNKKIRNAVLKNFGKIVFMPGGRIDRKKLREAAFRNRRSLNKLCGIVHPEVIKEIKKMMKAAKKIVIIDAPLLIEAGLHKRVDYIVVVKAGLKKQLERGARRGFKKHDCLARRRSQMPLRKKIKYADFVINNNRSREYTKKQVIKIWKELSKR